MSTFSGLNTANTGLRAQQRAMDVTGQNVANVNTDGYSRQRAELQSVGGNAVPAIYSTSSGIGQGVSADTVIRIRDAFLEGRAQTEHAVTASLTVQSSALSQIEDAFREPGTTGLQAQLSDMWAGWSDVANNPSDPGARAEVVQRTETLVAGLNTTSASLDGLWAQNRDGLDTLVKDVNASLASIATLNQAIKSAARANMPVNELADKRDVLVLALSDQIGATSTTMDDGTVSVSVGGATLLSGNSPIALELAGSTAPGDALSDPPRIVTDPGGTAVRPGGTALGQITTMTSVIPQYRASLDGVAQQLAQTLNDAQGKGYDRAGQPGKPLLDNGTGSGSTAVDPVTVTAANIRLRVTQPDELAAAAVSPGAAGGVTSADAGNAHALYQLRLGLPQPDGSVKDGPDATYRKMIVGLGVQAATASSNLATQSVISTQVDSSRESVSGVSIDEEMTNMLQFQHGYQAAGRLITAIDSMLDTLINHTGLVGQA